MSVPAEKLSLADFLTWENQQVERNEFYRAKSSPWWEPGVSMASLSPIW